MTVRPILLDTYALLWLANKEPISAAATAALEEAADQPDVLTVSPISAWEIGQLASKGRLTLPLDPLPWFEVAVSAGIGLTPLSPTILVQSSFLPGGMLKDPADRIIAATARTFGHRIMTRDRLLLDFADKGHAQAIAC